MGYIKRVQVSLIIGLAAVVIPITANVGGSKDPVIKERQASVAKQTANENARRTEAKTPTRPQDYYDRRREYWEKRMDRRLEESDEYMDEEDGDKSDKAEDKDAKNEDDSADKDVDHEEEAIERRREYWRQRLDKEW